MFITFPKVRNLCIFSSQIQAELSRVSGDSKKSATQTIDIVSWFEFIKVSTEIFRWASGHHIQGGKGSWYHVLDFSASLWTWD